MNGTRAFFWLLLAWIGLGQSVPAAENLSPLGKAPDWSRLEAYDRVVTREEFVHALTRIYSIGEAYKLTFDLGDEEVRIRTSGASWQTLRFRRPGDPQRPVHRTWRSRDTILEQRTPHPDDPVKPLPLDGLRVAIDPGHLGGRWAKMEERWYQRDDGGRPVTEGDMTLLVAQLLRPRLEALGADVFLVRSSSRPATRKRPAHFRSLAQADLARIGQSDPVPTYPPDAPPETRFRTLQWQQEKYFYRLSEIRHRAAMINDRYRPDLVLCLHFNAEAWGDPKDPRFVPRNHFHLLVNGAYSIPELGRDDERFEMLLRLLQGTHEEELALAETMAVHMARKTQLPAYQYTTNNVLRPSTNPYVYARNLLANRVYACPVIYFEPYVMNSEECYARIQAGLYEGRRHVAGRERQSLYHEYTDGVVQGLLAYYAPNEGDDPAANSTTRPADP